MHSQLFEMSRDLNEIIGHVYRKNYSYKNFRAEAEYFRVYSLVRDLPEISLENLDSRILSKQEFINLLQLCSFDIKSEWKQLYRATRDGFSADDFHTKCDGQSNTLSVIRTTLGFVFGGYATSLGLKMINM